MRDPRETPVAPEPIDPPESQGGGPSSANDPFERDYGGIAVDPPETTGGGGATDEW